MRKIDKQTNRILNKIDKKLKKGIDRGEMSKTFSVKDGNYELLITISTRYQGNKNGDASITIFINDAVAKNSTDQIH